MKIIINPKYHYLLPYIKKWCDPTLFSTHGNILHSGRNIIKIFEVEGKKYVVKSFCQMTTFNRLIYGRLRHSKSFRAYYHAMRLKKLGIDTPEHIAAVDIYKNTKLAHSYFISTYSAYMSSSIITENFTKEPSYTAALDALSVFISHIHHMGVLHQDLNINNILYSKSSTGDFLFQLIDTNRMSFHNNLSEKQRIKNLQRLSCCPVAFSYILKQYAYATHLNPRSVLPKGILARIFFEIYVWNKNKLKRALF